MRWARYLYGAALVLFLAGIGFQAFLAGLSLFDDPRKWAVHTEYGWTVAHGVPLLIIIFGALGRIGWRRGAWVAALVVSAAIQPFLPGLKDSTPLAAALHPVNALVLFGLTVRLLLDLPTLLRSDGTPDGIAEPGTKGAGGDG